MKTVIRCKDNRLGGHSFFINHDGKDYLLFNQRYHQSVKDKFKNGLDLNHSLDYKTANGDQALLKTISMVIIIFIKLLNIN